MAGSFSFKIYSNERLKPVNFHGRHTAPLYVQIVKNGTPFYFKSQIFNQCLNIEMFKIRNGVFIFPDLELIKKKEQEILWFLALKDWSAKDQSHIKKEYLHWTQDIIKPTHELFKTDLSEMLNSLGLPELGQAVLLKSRVNLFRFVNEMKQSFSHPYNTELKKFLAINLSPFLELMNYLMSYDDTLPILTYFDYQNPNTKSEISKNLRINKPTIPEKDILISINNL